MKRNMRVGAILKTLTDYPGQIFTLNYFVEKLIAAKSSVSEDIVILKKIFTELDLGKIETITGASGGVVLKPYKSTEYKEKIVLKIIQDLKDVGRLIPGGFIYYADILYNPHIVKDLGEIIAQEFSEDKIDYVMTVETKGIPIAMMTANFLNVPLVVTRKDNRVSEGATISINYVSGTTGKLQTMYCAKRSIKANSKVLIVDDFLKGGGTIRGMMDLIREFDSEVVGKAVFMENVGQKKKMIEDYYSILQMNIINDDVIVNYNIK
ncbi:MAG: pur operon repressor [Clostridiales bacterium]|nr:pur operon repressor [Clostridiales bacterium]